MDTSYEGFLGLFDNSRSKRAKKTYFYPKWPLFAPKRTHNDREKDSKLLKCIAKGSRRYIRGLYGISWPFEANSAVLMKRGNI